MSTITTVTDPSEPHGRRALRAVASALLLRVSLAVTDVAAAAAALALQRLNELRARPQETGAATAEYAIAMLAAVGFAGVLVVILRGDEVRGVLTNLVRNALNAAP